MALQHAKMLKPALMPEVEALMALPNGGEVASLFEALGRASREVDPDFSRMANDAANVMARTS